MKKILYDISLLGRGHITTRDRTGLYRFTEEVLKLLLSNARLDIYFTSSQLDFAACYDYLEHHFPLCKEKLIFVTPTLLFKKALLKIKSYLHKFNKKRPLPFLLKKLNIHFGFLTQLIGIHFDLTNGMSFDTYISPQNLIPHEIKSKNIQAIIFVHDLIPIIYPHKLPLVYRYFYKKLINSLGNEIIICNSNTTRSDLLKYRTDLDHNNVYTIYLGVSDAFKPNQDATDIEHVKQKYNIHDGKYILALSSLNPRKNFSHVIKSFVAFIRKYNINDLCLVVAGPEGWQYDDIFIAAQEFKDKVIFTGFIDEVDLSILYAGAFCFTFMSLYEGFGFCIVEAMKCALPVVTSNTSSLKEIASSGAITIDPKSEQELIDTWYNLYNSKDTRDSLSQAALKRGADFSWDKFGNELSIIINS